MTVNLNKGSISRDASLVHDGAWKLSHAGGGSATCFPVECRRTGPLWDVTMMTAGHVTEFGPEGWSARHHRGVELMDGAVLSRHERDVGLVSFTSLVPVVPRVLACRPARFGDGLVLVGYPAGEGPWVRRGVASGDGLMSCPIFYGDSGGPVALADGAVVGVARDLLVDSGFPVIFAARYTLVHDLGDWIKRY